MSEIDERLITRDRCEKLYKGRIIEIGAYCEKEKPKMTTGLEIRGQVKKKNPHRVPEKGVLKRKEMGHILETWIFEVTGGIQMMSSK